MPQAVELLKVATEPIETPPEALPREEAKPVVVLPTEVHLAAARLVVRPLLAAGFHRTT